MLEPPSQNPCGLTEMFEPNFLISEAAKKRRTASSGSTEREEACAWSARNRARRPATLVTGARVGEGPRTRRRPGEPPVSRPGIARRLVPRSIGAMTFGKRHSRAVSNFYWNFPFLLELSESRR